ncbi:MAG: hypothetical protein P0116_11120 [Candidatus Nitrosocosmicus sp.]|nr:hypothetical protein [Candidatus Nitrosocosmicus sp.]
MELRENERKSREKVLSVGTLGPISPAVVMYTLADKDKGFHQYARI